MMTVCDLGRGDLAVVLSVNAGPALRERLRILGVFSGARVRLLRTSFRKRTFLLSTQSGKVALGRTVAAGVKLCPIR